MTNKQTNRKATTGYRSYAVVMAAVITALISSASAFPLVFNHQHSLPGMNGDLHQNNQDHILESVIEAEQALQDSNSNNGEEDEHFIVDESRLAECLTSCYREFQRCTAIYQDLMTTVAPPSTTTLSTAIQETGYPAFKPSNSPPICDRGQKKCEFGCLSHLVAETTGQLTDFGGQRDSRSYFVDDGLNDAPLEDSTENEEDIIKL